MRWVWVAAVFVLPACLSACIGCGGAIRSTSADAGPGDAGVTGSGDDGGDCGGGSSSGGTSTGLPDGFVSAVLMNAPCEPGGPTVNLVSIGMATPGRPITVTSGGSNGGTPAQTAQIDCQIIPYCDGFSVSIDATVMSMGVSAPSFQITTRPMDLVTASGGTVEANLGDWQGHNCTLSFTYLGAPVPESPPVAPGRIWGHVECPMVTSGQGVRCSAEADFLVENCTR